MVERHVSSFVLIVIIVFIYLIVFLRSIPFLQTIASLRFTMRRPQTSA
jgi:hypothetical protein